MEKGTCKLCLQVKELRDSHYLPKRLYAFGRAKQLKNPNPLVISGAGAKQISDQLHGYVFCGECEDRFNMGGEGWILGKIPRDYGEAFPLQDALGSVTPILSGRRLNLYDGAIIPAFEMDKLVYFGISIFWRGAAHGWKPTVGLLAPKVELCGYYEPLRLFLLGTAPIPEDVALAVHIWPYTKVLQISYPVSPLHAATWQRYWFYIPGILFVLHFGKNVPEEVRDRAAHGEKRIIAMDLDSGEFIRGVAKEQVGGLEKTDKIKAMLQEIDSIRPKTSSKE
jgi:hypothetical protein